MGLGTGQSESERKASVRQSGSKVRDIGRLITSVASSDRIDTENSEK